MVGKNYLVIFGLVFGFGIWFWYCGIYFERVRKRFTARLSSKPIVYPAVYGMSVSKTSGSLLFVISRIQKARYPARKQLSAKISKYF